MVSKLALHYNYITNFLVFFCRYEEIKNLKEANLRDSHKGHFKFNTSLPIKKKKEASDVEGVKNNKPLLPQQISRADIAEIELMDNYVEPSVEDMTGNMTHY